MKTYLAAWAVVLTAAVLLFACHGPVRAQAPAYTQVQNTQPPARHVSGRGRRDCVTSSDWYGHFTYPCVNGVVGSLAERVAFCVRFEHQHKIWRVSDSRFCPQGLDGGVCRNINRQVLDMAWSIKDGPLKWIRQSHNNLENGFNSRHLAKQVYEFSKAEQEFPNLNRQLDNVFSYVNRPNVQQVLMPQLRLTLNCLLDEAAVQDDNSKTARTRIPAAALKNRTHYIQEYQEWNHHWVQDYYNNKYGTDYYDND